MEEKTFDAIPSKVLDEAFAILILDEWPDLCPC